MPGSEDVTRGKGCVEYLAIAMRILTIVGGLLMLVGAFLSFISAFPPTDFFDDCVKMVEAVYMFVFGALVLACEFKYTKILKWFAFLSYFAGKGMFFLYIGMSMLQGGSEAKVQEAASATTGSTSDWSWFISVIGYSMCGNGILNLVAICVVGEGKNSKMDSNSLILPTERKGGSSSSSSSSSARVKMPHEK